MYFIVFNLLVWVTAPVVALALTPSLGPQAGQMVAFGLVSVLAMSSLLGRIFNIERGSVLKGIRHRKAEVLWKLTSYSVFWVLYLSGDGRGLWLFGVWLLLLAWSWDRSRDRGKNVRWVGPKGDAGPSIGDSGPGSSEWHQFYDPDVRNDI